MTSRPALSLLLIACGSDFGVTQLPVAVNPADVLPCSFTELRPGLSVYDCNPVFSGTAEPWLTGFGSVSIRAQNVLGHPFYQAWYTSAPTDGAGWALGHATSADGVHWAPYAGNPIRVSGDGWDADNMARLHVLREPENDRYVLLYQGYNLEPTERTFGLGALTSRDGVSFTAPAGSKPVVDLSELHGGVDPCWPLTVDHTVDGAHNIYRGFIAASHRSSSFTCSIHYFETHEDIALPFGLYPSLVLPAGPERYDMAGVSSAAIVDFDEDRLLFYVGFESWEDLGNNLVRAERQTLNVAIAERGGPFVKWPGNPLPVDLGGAKRVSDVGAVRVGERVQLWVTDVYPALNADAVGTYLIDPRVLLSHP